MKAARYRAGSGDVGPSLRTLEHVGKSVVPAMAPGAMPPAVPSLQAATARAVPVIRYEASAKPLLPFEREEPWWAFLVRYKNIQMTLLALGFWVAMILVHTYLTRLTWHRGVVKFSMVGTPPLHDLLHEVLPNTQPLRVIPEVGHVLPVLYLSGLMLYHFDQRSLDCFRTFLVSHGVLIFLRAISFAGTLLPDASQQCHVSLFVGSCHDLIFSGHVTIMLMCVLLAQHYYEIPPVLRVFVGLDAAIVCFFVISSRNHYTVDVVLAVVVTLLVYLAFTRHPFLVSLCVETPVNVLALPTLLDAGQRGGVCGCVGPHDDPPLRTTREGYPVLGDGEALRRMSEHAFGALRLLGLRPSLTMRMVDAEGKPLPGGGVGLTEAALTGSATGATGGAASAGLGSTVTAGSASAATAGFESLSAAGFAAHSHSAGHDARDRHGQRVLGSLHAHRERDSRERDSDADGETPVHAHTAAAMRGAGAAAGGGHGSVTALGHGGDRDAALRQAARSRGVSAAELAAWQQQQQQQQALLGAWGHATASGVGVGAGAGSSLRHRHAGAVGHEVAIGAPWLHAPAGSHTQIGAQMAAQAAAQLHGKQARHSTPAAPVLSGSSSAPRPPRTGVTSAGSVASPAAVGGSAQRRSPAAAAPVAATVAAPGSASKAKGRGHSQPGSPLPSTGASGPASGSGLGADAHGFAVPPALTVSALHGGGTGGSDSLSSHSHSHSHGYSGVHSAALSVSSAGSAGGSSTGSAGASGTGSAAGGAVMVGSARGAGAAAAPSAHRSAGPSPSAGSDLSAGPGRSAPGSRRGSESSAGAAGPALGLGLGRTATAARRSGTGSIGYGAIGAGAATGPLPPPLSPVSSGGSLPASPDLPAHAHPHGHAHPHALSLPAMHAHPHGSGPHPLVLPGAAAAVAGAGARRPGPVPLSPRTAAAAQAALSISLRRRARALSDMAASDYRLLAAQAEAEAEAEGGMGLADDVDVEVDFDADGGVDAAGAGSGVDVGAAAGPLASGAAAADADADADAAADAEVEAEAVEAAAEEYYEMEAVLAHLIAARHARHTPNRQHLASELAAAMSRVRRSARRLLQPVSHITGWVRGFGGAAAEEGPADTEAGAAAGDSEAAEDGSASASASATDSAGTGSA